MTQFETGVVRNFSNAAAGYDDCAEVQKLAAAELIRLTHGAFRDGEAPKTILEIGCGTGIYSQLLVEAFPDASTVLLDASSAMLAKTRKKIPRAQVEFVCADAEDYAGGPFDLITSCSALHWLRDIPGFLRRMPEALTPGGRFTFATFGPETFRELRWSIQAATGGTIRIASDGFPNRGQIQSFLPSRAMPSVTEAFHIHRFETLRDLLLSIKKTGVRGLGAQPPIRWTRGLLDRVESVYRDRYGEIVVTSQIIYAVN
jgi:malonyl-CoA O-methyltransferase